MKHVFWLAICSFSLVSWSTAQDLYNDELIDTYDEQSLTAGETYARLTFAGRDVAVLHDTGEREEGVVNFPIASGDLLETGRQSFSELEFIDGSLMQLDHRTKVEFQAINENYDDRGLLTVIRLFEGNLMLHVTDQNDTFGDRLFRIDTEAGSAYMETPGIYSVEQDGREMRVKVYRGIAELAGERGSRLINSGEYANIRDFDRPTFPIPFNAFRGGSFERWAYDRRPGGFGASAKYVDRSISVYSRDLDDHGRWRYRSDMNTHVWVPSVNGSWRPYWNGFWTRSGVALTWVSYDSFGWVTHHYGRWGFDSDWGYYWIPNRYYSPAWVAWSSYDSYVGWCPLGFRNRPYYYGVSINIGRHHNHWNYIPAHSIVIGRRNYAERRAVPRHRRQIITNNVYVTRKDVRDADVLTRVIRQPEVNRERRQSVAARRGYLVSHHGNEATRHAVRIQSRDSGTRAKPRFSTRIRPGDGASILTTDRNAQGSERRNTSRNATGNGVLKRENSRGSTTNREPLSPLPGRSNTTAERSESKRGETTTQRSQSNQRGATRSTQTESQRKSPAAKPKPARERKAQTREKEKTESQQNNQRPSMRRTATQSPRSDSDQASGRTQAPTTRSSSPATEKRSQYRSSASAPAHSSRTTATRSPNRNSNASAPARNNNTTATRTPNRNNSARAEPSKTNTRSSSGSQASQPRSTTTRKATSRTERERN